MRFGISAIVRGCVVLVLTVVSQSWGAESSGQAMMILRSLDFADTQGTIAALEKEGVRPVHVIPPRVVIGFVPAEAEVRAAAIDNVVSIYRSAAPAIGPQEGDDLATGVSAWNHLVSQRGMAPSGIPPGATPLVGDALEPPMPEVSRSLTGLEMAALPGYYYTSEFMIGKVAVGVILPESNGSGENWDSAREQQVYNEIIEGMNWWATKGGSAAHLTFYYEFQFIVPTQYEPITMNGQSDEDTWVSDIFANLGYTIGNCFTRGWAYINKLRNYFGTDWSYAFIVVDSFNDWDGKFADGQHFAWAHPGGPYAIMTYDNGGWFIFNMNSVAAHETGHIFLAADEYCQPGYNCCDFGYYGYLNIYNGNCEDGNPSSVPCMMRSNEDAICQWTNGQIGWRDTDGDGVPDTIDNDVNNTLNPYSTPATQTIVTFTGTAVDVPCVSPTRRAVTINRISTVKYRVDRGAWADANAADGAFDEDVEDYNFTVGPLGNGWHWIETQAYSTSGNVSTVVGQDVVIQLYGGGSGTQANPFLMRTISHWQNLMNTSADWDKHFILRGDIDLEGVALSPVGNYNTPFTGVFDGNDNVIRNAVVNMPDSSYVGLFGYVGYNGYIHNLGVEDVVIIGGDFVGGLVGYSHERSRITSCYATGQVIGGDYVGGLVGENYYGRNITACYATGSVSGNDFVDGLVGSHQGGSLYNVYYGTIDDCYATGDVSGFEYVGGLVGLNGADLYDCYSTGSVSGTGNYIGGMVGWNFVNLIDCYATGSVGGSDYVGGLVGGSYGEITGCYATGDVSGFEYVGGLVGSNGDHLYACYATGSVSGGWGVGGLVGGNYGVLSDCYASGHVDGYERVGGLAGCSGENSAVYTCYATGDVSAIECVGSLVGEHWGGLTDCYAKGQVSGFAKVGGLVGYNNYGSLTACYATGSVSGQVEVGGLVGDNFYGSVTGCFWDLNTSSQLWSAGGEGKTTDEMKTKSTFTDVGWDFVNIWDICDGTNYPRLQWQTLPAADWSCPDGVGLEDFSYLADGWQMEFGINDLMMLCEQWLEGR